VENTKIYKIKINNNNYSNLKNKFKLQIKKLMNKKLKMIMLKNSISMKMIIILMNWINKIFNSKKIIMIFKNKLMPLTHNWYKPNKNIKINNWL